LYLGNSTEKFWKEEVKQKLRDRFPSSLTTKEETQSFDLRKSNVSLGFQLIRSFNHHTGVTFTSASQMKLIQDPATAILTEADFENVNFTPYEDFLETIKQAENKSKGNTTQDSSNQH
jgi:hypothetical protein